MMYFFLTLGIRILMISYLILANILVSASKLSSWVESTVIGFNLVFDFGKPILQTNYLQPLEHINKLWNLLGHPRLPDRGYKSFSKPI